MMNRWACFTKKILFLIVIFLFATNVFSIEIKDQIDNPLIDKIDRKDGLSNLSVSSIEEDKYGFLWFATQGGLNMYDGKEFTKYRSDPFDVDGLVNNLIQTTFYDQENHEIWLGTYQGISRYMITENEFDNFYSVENGLSNQIVTAICKDSEGYYWVGTLEGLNRINIDTKEIKNYAVNGNVVRDLLVDSENRLMVATYEGIYYYNPELDDLRKMNIELPSKYIMVLKEFEEGILTGGMWDGGLFQYNFRTEKLKLWEFPNNNIYTLEKTRDNTLWAGSWGGGLYSITENGIIHEINSGKKSNELSHPIVYSILEDESGILWIGTNGGGINKINPRKVNYTILASDPEDPNSLSSGKINALHKDSRGDLWILVYNQGIERFTTEGNLIKYNLENKKLLDNSVTTIIEYEDSLLVGNSSGLLKYNYQTDNFDSMDILPEEEIVYALSYDGKDLWIGTYSGGIYKYNSKTDTIINYEATKGKKTLSDNLVYAILTDSAGRVWVGTNNGLNIWNKDTDGFEKFYREKGNQQAIPSNNIRVLFEDSKGTIWIGSVGGGLTKYIEETNSFKTYTEEDGLSGNVIVGILEDSLGRIWISTHDGLSILNPENEIIDKLTPEDGIGGWEFNSAYFKDENNDLFFGGIHGIIKIDDQYQFVNDHNPKLYITDVELFRNTIESNRFIYNDFNKEFNHNENYLSFRFTALDYDAPDKVNYFYKLEGFNDQWINNKTRDYVSFSNLQPGEYELQVYGETIKGNITETETINFVIKQAWYKTLPALLIYFLIAVMILVAGIKIWKNRFLTEKNAELSNLNEKLEDVNQELEKISLYDSLTGLYNRRFFKEKSMEYIEIAKRSKLDLTLAMIDIDNFKKYNDEKGHVEGDDILVRIGQTISASLPRSTDFVARYGGDEFVAVLYDTNQEGAEIIFNKMKDEIKSIDKIEDYLSISIGSVSFSPEEEDNLENIIKKADDGLYEAKASGKNKIVFKEI